MYNISAHFSWVSFLENLNIVAIFIVRMQKTYFQFLLILAADCGSHSLNCNELKINETTKTTTGIINVILNM